jgi:hypothetical protein
MTAKEISAAALLLFVAWNAVTFPSLQSSVTSWNEMTDVLSTPRFIDHRSEICPAESRRPPLDPFSDLVFSFPHREGEVFSKSESPAYFSSYHCVGTGTVMNQAETTQDEAGSYGRRRPNHINRQCHYRNLYYRISDQTFHYFSSPAETTLWNEARGVNASGSRESYHELVDRMNVTLGHVSDDFTPKELEKGHGVPWRPEIHEGVIHDLAGLPDEILFARVDAPMVKRTVFALYHPFHSMNFGHLLWDDLLGIFSLLDRFDMSHDDSNRMIPLYVELPNRKRAQNFGGRDRQWRCGPSNPRKWNSCVKMYSRTFPDFLGIRPDPCSGDIMRTGNWLRGEKSIGVWGRRSKNLECTSLQNRTARNEAPPGVEFILLPNVVAGTARTGFYGCDEDCALGRTQEYFRFRDSLFRSILGPRESCIFHQKRPNGYITFSLSIESSRPELVYHFEDEIALARKVYGEDYVKVADFSTMSIRDQVALVANSAVLLTNHGGVGAASIFLPRGGAAIVFWHGKMRLEHHWYESAGYFRTVWVGVDERPWVNRTMALIEDQVTKAKIEWDDQSMPTTR